MYQVMSPLKSQAQVHATILLMIKLMIHTIIQSMGYFMFQEMILLTLQAHRHSQYKLMDQSVRQNIPHKKY